MDFDLNDEQRLLKDSVDRFVADRYGFEQRRAIMAEPDGWSRANWAQFAELGLLGLPFPENVGGFGGGGVETAIVAEAFGRGLVLEPYIATVLLGGAAVAAAGDAAQQETVLPAVAGGERLLALAHAERQSRYDLADVATTATRDGDGWRITGEKSLVLHGDVADQIVVAARVSGDTRARDGIGLFLVDAGAAGVRRRGYATQDGMRAAEIALDGAAGEALGDPETGLPVLARVVDRAVAALCSEAVGAMGDLHALTLDYLKTRKQFGRPIGEFQVLQHRAVDMLVSVEEARSMALFGTMMADADDPDERTRAISAVKVRIGKSARHVGQEAVQLHGGIGVTQEYKAGHLFKRLTMIELAFGDTGFHLARLARMGGLFAEAA